MLDRAHRFHGLTALSYAYKQGQTIRGGALSLKYAANARQQQYRAAVVVSKKVSKSAVTRNRIRRRVYEALRLQAGGITQSYDLIFMVFSAEVATMPAAHLHQQVNAMLRKARIITSVNA